MAKTAGSNRDQNISDEELRKLTGIGVGEEDQMEAAARDEAKAEGGGRLHSAAKDLAKREAVNAGVHGGLYAAEKGAFGKKIKPLAGVTREELKNLEKTKGLTPYDLAREAREKALDASWYKDTGKKAAKKGLGLLVRRHKRALFVTLIINALAVIAILLIVFLAPFKHIHFDTILRSVNFARFQMIVRKQFSAVVFNAAVLTQDSVGNFRNTPLVRQIRLAIPDQQLEQLAREGKVKWDFNENSKFGDEFLPLRESLKAVVIDGQRYEIDQFAREAFGKDYSQLSRRERFTVQNNFVREVNVKMGDLAALLPRHVRWNPMFQVRQRTGVRLIKFLDAARDYLGKTQPEAKAKFVDDTSKTVMDPSQRTATSPIDDFNEASDEAREDAPKAAKESRKVRWRSKVAGVASGARTVSDLVFATTAYCIARELNNAFSSPEAQADRESQAFRMGADLATTADQIKEHAVTSPAVGAANSMWDATADTPDASQAVLYKRATNQTIPNTEAYQTQQIPFLDMSQVFGEWQEEFDALSKGIESPLAGILSLIGIDLNIGQKKVNDAVCTALLNEQVQYGIAGAEIVVAIASLGAAKGVTAAIKGALELTFHFAAGLTLDKLLNMLVEWVVKEYARLYFTGLEQGAERFNAGYVAQNSIAQNSNRNVTYGAPMDLAESNASQQVAMDALRAEHQDQSFTHRYFAIDNPFSLVGLTAAKIPVSTGGFAASIQNGLYFMGSILSSPAKLFSSVGGALLQPKVAHAKEAISSKTTFGVTQWGWTVAEQKRIETDVTFSLIGGKDTNGVQKDPPLLLYLSGNNPDNFDNRMKEFDERYDKCYDPSTFMLQSDEPKDGVRRVCTREFLTTDDALHWRYYKALLLQAKQATGSVYTSQ